MDMEIVVLESVRANAKDQHQLKAGLDHAVTLLREVTEYAELQKRLLEKAMLGWDSVIEDMELHGMHYSEIYKSAKVLYKRMEAELSACLAKNPNPAGHLTAEASSATGGGPDPGITNEASGPVGLGPDLQRNEIGNHQSPSRTCSSEAAPDGAPLKGKPTARAESEHRLSKPQDAGVGTGQVRTGLFGWGGACEKCGKPVYPPTNRYMKAAACLGDRIWHGECFPPEGVSGAGFMGPKEVLAVVPNSEAVDRIRKAHARMECAAYTRGVITPPPTWADVATLLYALESCHSQVSKSATVEARDAVAMIRELFELHGPERALDAIRRLEKELA